MATDVSMAVSITDKTTQPLTNMRQGFKGLSKDADEARARLENFQKMQHTLEHDVDSAAKAMREARKEYAKTGDEASKTNFEKAAAQYDKLKLNLNRVSQSSKAAEKDLLSLDTAQSKTENRASGGSGIMAALGKAGAWQYLGQVGGEIAQTYMTSRFGSNGGTMAGSVLSGLGSGAAIGTMVGGPLGTAVGAAAGAAIGAVQGAVQNAEKKDDSFKSYVQDQYTNSLQQQADELSSGSSIAAQRETNQMSFTTLLGSADQAKSFLDKVQDMAAATPFEYDDLVTMAKSLKTYFNTDEILPLLTKVGDTGAALGMTTSDMSTIAQMLGRMQSSGKTTLEYLQPLIDRGIPVWDYLSKATGKTKQDVQEMVSKGLLPGEKAAKTIADAMGEANKGAMGLQAQTYSGLKSTLEDAENNLKASYGEGYNEVNKLGIKAQTEFLNGAGGNEMAKAKYEMGQGQAALENKKTQLDNDVITSMQTGVIADSYKTSAQIEQLKKLAKDYKLAKAELYDAKKSGNADEIQAAQIKIKNSYAEAQVLSENEYYNTTGAKLVEQGQLSLINSIQSSGALTGAYKTAGYSIGQELTNGIQSALSSAHFTISTGNVSVASSTLTASATTANGGRQGGHTPVYAAVGLPFVPYDNYPALLHHGERVLTANQARQADNSGSGVVITGNSFVVREEADIDKIASRLASQIALAKTLEAGGGA